MRRQWYIHKFQNCLDGSAIDTSLLWLTFYYCFLYVAEVSKKKDKKAKVKRKLKQKLQQKQERQAQVKADQSEVVKKEEAVHASQNTPQ